MERPQLLVITGPTASGKSGLALELAQRCEGEIVSADSMQIYRGMDIGTAKATPAERALVHHHLIDIVNPDEAFTAAQYAQLATSAIEDIISRSRLPILCGGTGLYIESVLYEMEMGVAPDPVFRGEINKLSSGQLHALLAKDDPATAERLHPNDKKRIVRALEILHVSGVPASRIGQGFRRERKARFTFAEWAIIWPREELYQRIDKRVDEMMAQGLLEEVQALMRYDQSLPALQGIGYKELLAYLYGEMTLNTAIEAIKQGSRRYAKRQMTWFNRDERVKWVESDKLASQKIKDFLE